MSVYYADAHRVGLRLNLFECDDEPQPATDHLEFSSHLSAFTVDQEYDNCPIIFPRIVTGLEPAPLRVRFSQLYLASIFPSSFEPFQ